MNRVHLVEIHELTSCPRVFREGLTDFLQLGMRSLDMFGQAVPVLQAAVRRSGTRRVVDLCAGGGGPWLRLLGQLGGPLAGLEVVLTDKYPSHAARARVDAAGPHGLSYLASPVDAADVPADVAGFRTMFNAFHHFQPAEAHQVLSDAVSKRQGIAVFECAAREPWSLFLMTGLPALVLLSTPFVRPFSWARLFWTYLVPVIPLVVLFDGIVSCLRTYSVEELEVLAQRAGGEGWTWEAGRVRAPWLPIPVTYLVGCPPVEAAGEG